MSADDVFAFDGETNVTGLSSPEPATPARARRRARESAKGRSKVVDVSDSDDSAAGSARSSDWMDTGPRKRARRASSPSSRPPTKRRLTEGNGSSSHRSRQATKDSGDEQRRKAEGEGEASQEQGTDAPKTTRKRKSNWAPASELPLTVAPSATGHKTAPGQSAMLLVQLEDETMDFAGDAGAIGRLTTTESGIILDLKGHRYAGTIVPSTTHMIVTMGEKEAKVESVTNDFLRLDHLADVMEEIGGSLVEGTSEGDLFYFEDVDVNRKSRGAGETAEGDDQKPLLHGRARKAKLKRSKGSGRGGKKS